MKGYAPLKNGGYVLKEFEARLAEASPETILREGRQRKLSVVELPGARVYVKTFFDDAGLLGLVRRGRYRARREFKNLVRAFEIGVPVPRPIALVEARNGGAVWTEELAGMRTLRSVFEQPMDFPTRTSFLSGLGRFLRDVHDRGFYHEDLHAGNILVDGSRFAVVDLAGVSFAGKPLPKAQRVESLTIVLTSFQVFLNMTDYVRVLRAYGLGERGVWNTMARRLVELRARFVDYRAKKSEGAGSSFVKKGKWLVFQEIDVEPPRMENFSTWTPVGDGLIARTFPTGKLARRWWVQSWKLKYNLITAPLGVMWNGRTIVARRDPRWLPAAGEVERPRPDRKAFLGDLGRFLRRLHDLGVSIPDLHVEDILYLEVGPGRFRFGLSDPSRADCVVEPDRARELGSLAASVDLSRTEGLRVMKAYAGWSRDYLRKSFLAAVGRGRDAGLKRQAERKQHGR
jgi:tRNA A-37 threonylcarbamoyl transferase component Bud32